jgi:hypothetical protein
MAGAGATYNHHIDGACLVKVEYNVNSNTSGLQTLGYTIDGARLSLHQYERPIHGDQNGGNDGPPVDIIIHGWTVDIALAMVDFDFEVLEDLMHHLTLSAATTPALPNAASLTPPAPGTLLFGRVGGTAQHSVRLVLVTATQPLNFLQCMLTNPHDWNKGTNERVEVLRFRSFENSNGILSNATVT